jgi:hypothetical protein
VGGSLRCLGCDGDGQSCDNVGSPSLASEDGDRGTEDGTQAARSESGNLFSRLLSLRLTSNGSGGMFMGV